MAKEVAKQMAQKSGSVSLPDWMEQYKGEGQEDITKDDIRMPRLMLGQSMTPLVKDKMAEEGDFIHNITHEILASAGDELLIIPIAYSKEFILWKDRKNGGGILARAQKVLENGIVRYKWDRPNQTFEDKFEGSLPVTYHTRDYIDQDKLNDWGTQIPEDQTSKPAATVHHNYVVMLPEFENQMIALSLSRSSAKKGEEFNTKLKMGPAPTFGRIYRLSSFIDSADDNKFANYLFSNGFTLLQDQELFLELRDMHESLKDRGVNVDYSDEAESDTSEDDPDKF